MNGTIFGGTETIFHGGILVSYPQPTAQMGKGGKMKKVGYRSWCYTSCNPDEPEWGLPAQEHYYTHSDGSAEIVRDPDGALDDSEFTLVFGEIERRTLLPAGTWSPCSARMPCGGWGGIALSKK